MSRQLLAAGCNRSPAASNGGRRFWVGQINNVRVVPKRLTTVPEGRDSYDASSCGSGSQDDHSDVASWVALDLRLLSRRDRNSMNGDTSTLENGYDDVAVDSDFYGYAAEPGTAGSSIWSTTQVAHQADGDSQHSFDMRLRDKSRFYNHDRATPPTHLQPISSKQ